MPYRVELWNVDDAALGRVIELGALDAEIQDDGRGAVLMPDDVAPARVARALGIGEVAALPAEGRDADSVWVLRPRAVRAGRLRLVPAELPAEPGDVRLIDAAAFGTGLHPTTALCLEILDQAVQALRPAALLDVGTGSGVLALAALRLGVPRATGIDIDDSALSIAAENARLNGLDTLLTFRRGGPDHLDGVWPLVVANVLAAPLIEMAPALVRCVGHHGQLVLSGIPVGVEEDVHRAYRHLGMTRLETRSRAGWAALVLQASW